MAPVATMFSAILLLVAVSTSYARFVTPGIVGEAQREAYDSYSQAGEQELDAPALETLREQAKKIFGEVQGYEEPLMSEIQARCKNYHGYLAGNIRIAGTVCPSTSRTGCARIIAGRRGLIGSMKICHPDGRTLCYKEESGIVTNNIFRLVRAWQSFDMNVPVPGDVIEVTMFVEDDIYFYVPDFIRRC